MVKKIKVAIAGCTGRMGKMIAKILPEYKNFELEFDWKIDRGTDAGFYMNLTSDFIKNNHFLIIWKVNLDF